MKIDPIFMLNLFIAVCHAKHVSQRVEISSGSLSAWPDHGEFAIL